MKTSKSKIRKVVAGIVIGSVIILGTWTVTQLNNKGNSAEAVTRPIEEKLLASGVTKVCTMGDDGHGSDNRLPWYSVYFESSLDRSKALDATSAAAEASGFGLAVAPEGTKGYLGDVVYTAKAEGGNELAVAFTNTGNVSACGVGQISPDEAHTAITLEIRLPEYE